MTSRYHTSISLKKQNLLRTAIPTDDISLLDPTSSARQLLRGKLSYNGQFTSLSYTFIVRSLCDSLVLSMQAASTVYMIRHAEKPDNGSPHLSSQGLARAQRLRHFFGKDSGFDIGYIIAEHPKQGSSTQLGFNFQAVSTYCAASRHPGLCVKLISLYLDSRLHPYETVKPLADDLGVTFNTSIDRDDAAGVAEAVDKYKEAGNGNILICWEHHNLSDIAKAIGIKGFAEGSGGSGEVKYPGSHFDLVWVVTAPYDEITQVLSQDNLG